MISLLRRALAAGLVASLAAAPSLAAGKVMGPALPPLVVEGLEPIGKYRILVDGKPAEHQHVALAAQASSVYLLQGDGLGHGVLIRPRDRDVVRLAEGNVQRQLDGTFRVDAGGPGDVVGPFAVDEDGLVFSFDGQEVRLGQSPVLLGDRNTDELIEKQEGYAFRARQFVPKAAAMEVLRKAPEGVRVKTFFGSWCSACSAKLPRLLRIALDLRGTPLGFQFYGVPSPFKGEPEAEKYKITSVPTGVVLVGDEEIGRITGADWERPAESIERILKKAGKL